MSNYQIVFFTTSENQSPIVDFIRSLDYSTRAKIDRIVSQLANLGPQIRPPLSKQISHNLFEIRVRGQVEVRIFYSFEGKFIWLWHAYIKKTMKIPSKEINVALQRKNQTCT